MGKKPKRMCKLSRKAKARAMKAAKHLSGPFAHAAFSYANNRAHRDLGKFGPASPVRRIEPATGEAISEVVMTGKAEASSDVLGTEIERRLAG